MAAFHEGRGYLVTATLKVVMATLKAAFQDEIPGPRRSPGALGLCRQRLVAGPCRHGRGGRGKQGAGVVQD